MKLNIPAEVTEALVMLNMAGHRSFLVGGVRDLILGKNPNDWDIATSARPEQIKNIFSEEIISDVGEKFGTITVCIGSESIDITTFRKESIYSDKRHPDSVVFTDNLFEDMKRRDFTVNAISYSPEEGMCDFFCGRRDLKKHIIRAIGDPDKRFQEDPLRILRAIRFASTLGFQIEERTKKSVHENRELLKSVSAERIQKEFSKMLCGKNICHVMLEYSDVLGVFLPEVLPAVGFAQKSPYHKFDVWQHTSHAVSLSPPILEIRTALFFHDISKPACFSVDQTGRGHFYSHPKKSAVIAKNALEKLKYPAKFIENVESIVLYHDSHPKTDFEIKKILSAIGPRKFWQLTSVIEADSLAHAGWTVKGRIALLEELKNNARRIISSGECYRLSDLEIDGNDILSLGYSGENVGKTLNFVFEAVLSGQVPNKKEDLLNFISKNKT